MKINSLLTVGLILIALIVIIILLTRENRQCQEQGRKSSTGVFDAMRTVGAVLSIILAYEKWPELVAFAGKIFSNTYPIVEKAAANFLDKIFKLFGVA